MANVEEKKNELDDKKIFTSNAQRTTTVAKGENIIELKDVTIRFNKNNLKVDNLKEYFIRLVTKQLMFQEFIALKDINLDIKKGEAWGFLGTNGAGKSTLLKVVSRFIESKFDDIVEFSELQDFLDSPVKNFSSGMKTRLAFSIATAVEPDILIADEILAVGDMRFKKKCAAKMTAMLEDGTTLLYVSHNIAAVKKQCNKAMWLDHGNVVMVGDADTVCDAFKAEMDAPAPAKAQSKDKK